MRKAVLFLVIAWSVSLPAVAKKSQKPSRPRHAVAHPSASTAVVRHEGEEGRTPAEVVTPLGNPLQFALGSEVVDNYVRAHRGEMAAAQSPCPVFFLLNRNGEPWVRDVRVNSRGVVKWQAFPLKYYNVTQQGCKVRVFTRATPSS